jgi:hypothetical protein
MQNYNLKFMEICIFVKDEATVFFSFFIVCWWARGSANDYIEPNA